MNTFTKHFMEENFASFQPGYVFNSDNLIRNEIPAVEIPGLDADKLKLLEHQARSRPDLFTSLSHASHHMHWYTQQRSQGWKVITIKKMNNPATLYHSSSTTLETDDSSVVTCTDETITELALDIFRSVNLTVKQLHILKLEPNGWIQPHMDTFADPVGLDYFWIPLHEFPLCLKVYPWNWLNHKFGNMYLFNYSRWVHAVHNNTNQDRLILNGRLDIESLPDWFIKNFDTQRHVWKDAWKDINHE